MKPTLKTLLLATAMAAVLPGAGAWADGMRVVRDAQTGELRAPNSEELRTMQAQEKAEKAARKARGEADTLPQETTVRTHAGGIKSATLGEEHLVQVVASRDENGKLVVKHESPADEHPQPTTALPTE
jgi:hypothetical protein